MTRGFPSSCRTGRSHRPTVLRLSANPLSEVLRIDIALRSSQPKSYRRTDQESTTND